MIRYNEFDISLIADVKKIYENSNWQAYLNDDEKLKQAFNNSLYVLGAFDDEILVGFVRCVGDGEHIVVVQDLIVTSKHQQKGIGTHLFKAVWERYSGVRSFIVITDIEDKVDNKFYQSFGMKKLEEGNMVSYFR